MFLYSIIIDSGIGQCGVALMRFVGVTRLQLLLGTAGALNFQHLELKDEH